MNIEPEKLDKLLFRYGIVISDVDDVIDFVSDLLDEYAADIERTEPYATVTIQNIKKAAYEVYNLHEYTQETEV